MIGDLNAALKTGLAASGRAETQPWAFATGRLRHTRRGKMAMSSD